MKITIRAPQSKNHASHPTAYVSTRPKNEAIEGKEDRFLFSEHHDKLTVEQADRIISNSDEKLQRGDTFHFVISLRPEDFDKTGRNEEERQAAFRDIVRAGMKEMEHSLNAQEIRWAAGIHRNTDNPHAHIVAWKEYRDTKQYKDKVLREMPYRLLPKHQEDAETIRLVNSPFIQAIEDKMEEYQAIAERDRFNPIYKTHEPLLVLPERNEEQPAPSSLDEPEWFREAFTEKAEHPELEPDFVREYLDAKEQAENFHSSTFWVDAPEGFASLKGQQLYREQRLAKIERDLESFDRSSYYWQFTVRDEGNAPTKTSLNEINKRATAQAYEYFRSQGVGKPNPDAVKAKTEQFKAPYQPQIEHITAQLNERRANLIEEHGSLSHQLKVGRAAIKEGQTQFAAANIKEPKATLADSRQAQFLITNAIRANDTEQLKEALETTHPSQFKPEWWNGKALLAEALQARDAHRKEEFESNRDYTKDGRNDKSYATLLRTAQYLSEQARIIDSHGNLFYDNLIPSQYRLRQANAQAAQTAAAIKQGQLNGKQESLVTSLEARNSITEQLAPLTSSSRTEISWSEYLQITEIAAQTRNFSLFEKAQAAEIADSGRPTDLELAKGQRAIELLNQSAHSLQLLEEDRMFLKEKGRSKSIVVEVEGKEYAMSLNASERDDAKRFFNLGPSERTKLICETLNNQWYALNDKIAEQQAFGAALESHLENQKARLTHTNTQPFLERPEIVVEEKLEDPVREAEVADERGDRKKMPEPERTMDYDITITER